VDAYSHWEEFSIRWTGYVQAPTSDSYTFIATTSDGVRLWVNGNQVINHWIDRAMSDSSSVPIALTQGQSYAITMEYYENWDQAGAQLSWSAPSRPRQVIPQQSLYTYQANAQFTTSLAWSISGLVLPAGQAVLPYYRLVINYTPSDGQGVPSSAVGLFEIVDLPSPTVVFPDVARVVGDPSFSLASSSTGGGVPSYSIVSQTPSGTISLTEAPLRWAQSAPQGLGSSIRQPPAITPNGGGNYISGGSSLGARIPLRRQRRFHSRSSWGCRSTAQRRAYPDVISFLRIAPALGESQHRNGRFVRHPSRRHRRTMEFQDHGC
jgi:hypothetical protein